MSNGVSTPGTPDIENLAYDKSEVKYFHKMLPREDIQLIEGLAGKKGFSELTQTQHEAFLNGVLDDGNHLLIAQTGNGKTFIAESLSKKVLQNYGRVAYLVPSKQLQKEKVESVRNWTPDDVTVGGRDAKYRDADILVKTFDSYFTALIRGVEAAKSIDIAVFDDFHELYSDHRGSKIEKALTMTLHYGISVFAMSATIGEPRDIAQWFNAELTKSNEGRCNPLDETAINYNEYDTNTKTEAIGEIVAERSENAPFLVFTNSKRKTKGWAEEIAQHNAFSSDIPDDVKDRFEREIRSRVTGDLSDTERSLIQCMKNGVAFHHAGLPTDLQSYIIDEFDESETGNEDSDDTGYINCVVCTTTLAYGFDSDTQSVVVGGLTRWDHEEERHVEIGKYEYIQWIGRAARKGTDYDEGNVYIIHNNNTRLVDQYEPGVQPKDKTLPPVKSHFSTSRGETPIRKTFLQLIDAGWQEIDELRGFLEHTLFGSYLDDGPDWWEPEYGSNADPDEIITTRVKETLRWLGRNGFIKNDKLTGEWTTTTLGEAAVQFYSRTWKEVSVEALHDLWVSLNDCEDLTPEGLLFRIVSAFPSDAELNFETESDDPRELLTSYVKNLDIDTSPVSDSRAATTALLLGEWCRGFPTEKFTHIYEIDKVYVERAADFINTVMTAGKPLITGHPDVTEPEWYDAFATQVRYGIPPSVLSVMHVDQIGRARAVTLNSRLHDLDNQAMNDWSRPGVTVQYDVYDFVQNECDGDYTDAEEKLISREPDGVAETTIENLLNDLKESDSPPDPDVTPTGVDVDSLVGESPMHSLEFDLASDLDGSSNSSTITDSSKNEEIGTQSTLQSF